MTSLRNAAFLISLILLPVLAGGQTIESNFEITSPPSPVGSGARAMGAGGAFIAIADDATAASWNPAALINLELPEASVVLTEDWRKTWSENVEFYDVNYISLSYPFSIGGINMILSANYQRLYDFYAKNLTAEPLNTRDFEDVQFLTPASPPFPEYDVITLTQTNWTSFVEVEAEQKGEIGAIAPAFAIQIVPSFSVGVTWNFWRDGWIGERFTHEKDETGEGVVRMGQALWYDTDGNCTCNGGNICDDTFNFQVDDSSCIDALVPIPGNPAFSPPLDYRFVTRREEKTELEGQNFNVGFLWDIGRWTVGGVYRSEFTADIEKEFEFVWEQTGSIPIEEQEIVAEFDEELTFPASYGLGVAFRYSDALTFTMDVTQVEWNRYILEDKGGNEISPVNGLLEDEADIDPTLTIRAGAEYLNILPKFVIPIRAGYFYDQQPARDEPEVFQGMTLGTGLAYKWIVLDAAFFYRWGYDVTVATTTTGDHKTLLKEEKGNTSQQMVMISAIIHMP